MARLEPKSTLTALTGFGMTMIVAASLMLFSACSDGEVYIPRRSLHVTLSGQTQNEFQSNPMNLNGGLANTFEASNIYTNEIDSHEYNQIGQGSSSRNQASMRQQQHEKADRQRNMQRQGFLGSISQQEHTKRIRQQTNTMPREVGRIVSQQKQDEGFGQQTKRQQEYEGPSSYLKTETNGFDKPIRSLHQTAEVISPQQKEFRNNVQPSQIEEPRYSVLSSQKQEPQRIKAQIHQNGLEVQNIQVAQPIIEIQNSASPQCGVNLPEERLVNPSWIASYPGSGAKLTWKLIRAITGLWTSDDHDHNGRVESGLVVAVKTHFPSHTPKEVFFKPSLQRIQRAILILRSPLASIPSYHNFVYEQMNKLRNHSTRAPIEVWLKWRDEFFEAELRKWVDHAQYWIENYSESLFLLPFEHLTSPTTGIETLTQLSVFFANADSEIGNHMVPPQQLPCIWEMYVKGKNLGSVESKARHSHREGRPIEYPYTNVQLRTMITVILQLRDTSPTVVGLHDLLTEYAQLIQNTITQQAITYNEKRKKYDKSIDGSQCPLC